MFKKIIGSLLAACLAIATMPICEVYAQELELEMESINEESCDLQNPEFTSSEMCLEVPEIGSMDLFSGNDNADEIIIQNSAVNTLSFSGDQYEANNGPNVATINRYNRLTNATIHAEDDVDWYKIEVLSSTEPISIFLTNIPNGCDYDLYMFQYDATTNTISNMYYNLQTGNTSEELWGTVSDIGTYYVVVQAKQGIEDNYSDSEYTLFMGNYYQVGQYGYVDTGLDISFGYIAVGNQTPVYRGWYTYNLSNNYSIPDDAFVTKAYLTGDGNGAYWIGFNKMMAAGDSGYRFDDKLGQINVMYTRNDGDQYIPVKQRWLIGGNILASTNFVWEPQILIAYNYSARLQNLRFLH